MRSYWRHIVLAGFIGCSDMATTTSTTFTLPDGSKIQSTQPPNQKLRLHLPQPLNNDSQRDVVIAKWETKEQRLLNVECRLTILDWPRTGLPYTVGRYRDPIVSYWLQLGMGPQSVMTPPLRTQLQEQLSQRGGYAVPARGAVLRVSARSVIVHVRFEGNYPNPDPIYPNANYPWVDVQVSFAPVDSVQLSAAPPAAYAHTWMDTPWGYRQAFPPEASEFRLVRMDGTPFAPGFASDIALETLIGSYLLNLSNATNTYDRAQFADWTPITPRMFGWLVAKPSGFFPEAAPPAPGTDESQGVIALYR